MPSWELEIAADELRRKAPEDWKKFTLALTLELQNAVDRLVNAASPDLAAYRGEVLALRNLIQKLNNAYDVVVRLKGREDG